MDAGPAAVVLGDLPDRRRMIHSVTVGSGSDIQLRGLMGVDQPVTVVVLEDEDVPRRRVAGDRQAQDGQRWDGDLGHEPVPGSAQELSEHGSHPPVSTFVALRI